VQMFFASFKRRLAKAKRLLQMNKGDAGSEFLPSVFVVAGSLVKPDIRAAEMTSKESGHRELGRALGCGEEQGSNLAALQIGATVSLPI
jgi:hypothetical protein